MCVCVCVSPSVCAMHLNQTVFCANRKAIKKDIENKKEERESEREKRQHASNVISKECLICHSFLETSEGHLFVVQ